MSREELLANPILRYITKEAIDEAKAEYCKRSFAFFIKEFWEECVKDELIWNWHIDEVANDLQDIGTNLILRKPKYDYIMNLFPGASKSSILSKLYPTWLWSIDPSLCIITVSYADKLANENAMGSRDILQSEKYLKYFPDVRIRTDYNKIEHYKTTKGGERISTTPTGTLTGFHGHIIICDELQNVKKASSQIERDNLIDWLTSTLPSRKKNLSVTPTIFCQQRLHPNDATGFLLSQSDNYKRLCIPVELDKSLYPEDLEKHYIDGLAFPIRFTRQALNELKEVNGARTYNTQFLMNPTSDNDSILKKDWFKEISQQDFDALINDKQIVYNFFIDSAVGEKKHNDPSAILACAKVGPVLYITGISTVKLEFYKMTEYIKAWVNQNGFTRQSKCYVEPKATGPAFVDYLQKQSELNIVKGADPRASKKERLTLVSPAVESGKVVLVNNGKWNIDRFLSEVTAINPVHDDQRDVLISAINQEILSKPIGYGRAISWR